MKLVLAVAAILVAASSLKAQQPPDTLPVAPADTIATTGALLGEPAADTLADSLRVRLLPEVDGRLPAGFATGIWVFEREQLLALRGNSLADLLAQVPGITRLRGGDYGAPETVTAYGLAGGGVRVFWDGFEQVSLEGSVVDLSRIGLGGVESVRVERKPGELRIELASLRDTEARPTSLIEVGTGDYDTNFFRGTFVHPRAAGGSLGLALDRVDTNGRNGEDGTRTGGWLRFTRHWGDDIALSAEVRRMNSGAEITGYPGKASRTDWIVRGRWRPASGLAVQAYTGRSILEGLDRDGHIPVDRDRRQHGVVVDFPPWSGASERRAPPVRRQRCAVDVRRPIGGRGSPRGRRSDGRDIAGVVGWSVGGARQRGRLEPPRPGALPLRGLGVGHARGGSLSGSSRDPGASCALCPGTRSRRPFHRSQVRSSGRELRVARERPLRRAGYA